MDAGQEHAPSDTICWLTVEPWIGKIGYRVFSFKLKTLEPVCFRHREKNAFVHWRVSSCGSSSRQLEECHWSDLFSLCSSSSTDLVNSGDESVSESTWKANLNVCSCIRLIGIAAQIFNISNLIQDLPSPQLPPIAFQQPNSSISNVRVGPHLTTECLHQYR